MKIHLGVIDVPEPEGGTSYTVAQRLEEDYNLFSVFWDYEQDNAIFALTESVSNALEQYMSTGNIPNDIFADATEEIDKDFRQLWLNSADRNYFQLLTNLKILMSSRLKIF